MNLSAREWHRRFRQQAQWTQVLRSYLFERTGLGNADRILSVGCGTGAILQEIITQHPDAKLQVFGIDISQQFLPLAKENAPRARLTCGDAHQLPYPDGSFDLSLCHFLLLWVNDPARVLAEMARITRPGGAVLALAEPDYGGRIDYPVELEKLGRWQQEALSQQGADPLVGRRLASLFAQAGLQYVETGVLGGQWAGPPSQQAWESEWIMLRADLQGIVSPEMLQRLQSADQQAWQHGKRVLYVPTFYAWGRAAG